MDSLLTTCGGGYVFETPEGAIVFVSPGASNPMTASQLREVALTMDSFESPKTTVGLLCKR